MDLKARIFDEDTIADLADVATRQSLEDLVSATVNDRISSTGQVSVRRVPFNNASLSLAGVFVHAHNLGRVPLSVRVVDPNGEKVTPDKEIDMTAQTVAVDLATFRPLMAGDWQLLLIS